MMIIYKQSGTICATSEENYNARIQDARKIRRFEIYNGWQTLEEVAQYIREVWKEETQLIPE